MMTHKDRAALYGRIGLVLASFPISAELLPSLYSGRCGPRA